MWIIRWIKKEKKERKGEKRRKKERDKEEKKRKMEEEEEDSESPRKQLQISKLITTACKYAPSQSVITMYYYGSQTPTTKIYTSLL